MQEQAELTMVYVNSTTGRTFGTCTMRETLMSKATKDALEKFLELAEEDFAGTLAHGAAPSPDAVREEVDAESSGGLGNPFRRS
jgi:hypothetical protein